MKSFIFGGGMYVVRDSLEDLMSQSFWIDDVKLYLFRCRSVWKRCSAAIFRFLFEVRSGTSDQVLLDRMSVGIL